MMSVERIEAYALDDIQEDIKKLNEMGFTIVEWMPGYIYAKDRNGQVFLKTKYGSHR
ncbi:hypothetical protein [Magnetovibrio blakemorei]|uniref:hypothetical protein n=1 Tax=Magnetovibrio blakemorei TaxID=28181 RepID=UPI00147A4ADD|nr:hypothetical protein [Magnetovibrio blakemorei]